MAEAGGQWGWGRCYSLALMTVAYITGEVAHFLINTTGRAVAREVHFGELACFPSTNSTTNSTECAAAGSEEACSRLGCSWDYSGLGLEYQLLAGPAFVAVFSVSAVVLAVASDRLASVPRTKVRAWGCPWCPGARRGHHGVLPGAAGHGALHQILAPCHLQDAHSCRGGRLQVGTSDS